MTDLALLLHVLAVGLAMREGVRRWGERRSDVVYVLVGVLWAVVAFVLLSPELIPVDLITVLHEGRSDRSIAALYANGAHSLPSHNLVLRLLADGHTDIRDAVRLNLVVTGLNAWLLGLLGARLGRRWSVGIVAAGLFLASPPIMNAAVSTYGAPLATLCFLLGLPALERLSRSAAPLAVRVEAFVHALAWFGLAGLTRREWQLSVLLLTVLGALCLLWEHSRSPRARAFVQRALSSFAVRAALLVVLVVAFFVGIGQDHQVRWIASALNPLAPLLLRLPTQAAMLCVPLGVVALAVVGGAGLVRLGPVGWLGPLLVAGLFKLFTLAGHDVEFEYLRYFTSLVGPLLLLAAFGWRVVEQAVSGWRLHTVGVLLAVVSVAAPWMPSPASWLHTEDEVRWPLGRNKQKEVRLLVKAVEAEPHCLFVSRLVEDDAVRVSNWQFAFYGAGLNNVVALPEDTEAEAPLQAALARMDHHFARCIRVFRSLDCNLKEADCSHVEEGLELAQEWKWPTREYSDPDEYGPWRDEIRLAVYRVELPSEESNGSSSPP